MYPRQEQTALWRPGCTVSAGLVFTLLVLLALVCLVCRVLDFSLRKAMVAMFPVEMAPLSALEYTVVCGP